MTPSPPSGTDFGSPKMTPEGLLGVLCEPERFALRPGVWLALNAGAELVRTHPPHTLAGRLSQDPLALHALAVAAGLWGRPGLKPIMGVPKALATARAESAPSAEALWWAVLQDEGGVFWLRHTPRDAAEAPFASPAQQLGVSMVVSLSAAVGAPPRAARPCQA